MLGSYQVGAVYLGVLGEQLSLREFNLSLYERSLLQMNLSLQQFAFPMPAFYNQLPNYRANFNMFWLAFIAPRFRLSLLLL